MKTTIAQPFALTIALFCILLFSIQSNAQPTQNEPTLNWDPIAGKFIVQAAPRQNFPPPILRAASLSAIDYPTTIRVRHHPQNSCRTVPADQIDTIPFEEYVARVLPSEVPASWEPATLQAQAVAIRTYAWRQILAERDQYDVSDWIDFQNMCDERTPATDAAVTATAGQYLSAISDPQHLPIVAMYSAENSHPTLTNPNVDYLQAVPDLYSLGRERFGHGYGLSQWGAQRRALAGHTYADILGHYYTNVYLTNALQPEEITARLIGPLDGELLNGNGFHWRTLLGTNHVISPTITIARSSQSGIISITNAVGVWQPIQPVQHQEVVTLSLQISNTQVDQRSVQFDTLPPPTPTLTTARAISMASLPITISTLSTTEIGIGQQWIWAGDSFTVTTDGWRSPPTTVLPADQNYRALVNLRLANPLTETIHAPLAQLKISDLDFTVSSGKTVLGMRYLWASDLAITPTAHAVDFHLFDPPRGLMLDLAPSDAAEFVIESMQILRLPTEIAAGESAIDLPLYAVNGETEIFAAAFDDAGNISKIVSQTVQVNDIQPPIIGPPIINPSAQSDWHTSSPLTVSIPLTDKLSGLDLQRGALVITAANSTELVDSDSLTVTFARPENPWAAQAATVLIPTLDDGRYDMRFTSADAAGNNAQTNLIPLRIDTTRPTVDLELSATSSIEWHKAPISFTLTASDTTSGIDVSAYTVNGGSTQRYAEPVTIGNAGRNQIRAWSNDVAGNQSQLIEAEIGIDLAAPTIDYSTTLLGPSMIEVTWQAEDDASGIASILLQKKKEGLWIDVPLSVAGPSAGTTAIQFDSGGEQSIRMSVVDNAGRSGGTLETTINLPTSWHYFPLIMGR